MSGKNTKKMLRTKYGQKPLKHARKGVQSCLLAAASLFFLFLLLFLSFAAKGDVGILAGFAGLAVAALAGAGLSLGIRGFKERDKNYITCRVGTACSGAVLLGMAALFIRGLI